MTDDFIGRTLGQYRIEAPLGSGGMGQVYRGVHRLLNRPAAIKVMQAHLAANPDFQRRFLLEAQAIAALKHTNIVEIYDFGEQDGNLYLVMELMTDGSLRTLLRRNAAQPLPLSLGLDLMQQAAKGLAASQAMNMVHRDIKPDNLLLNRLSEAGRESGQYVLKISDFGLARLAESALTTTGVPMGTLDYMSPEQCQNMKLDGRSDLYSLGIVFYEVVTGYKPFQINDFSEALDKHVNVSPKPPREIRPYLSPGLEAIILRCLAKKPEERYASGTELVAALQRELGNVGPQTMTQLRTTPEQSQPTGGTVLQPPGMGGTPPPVVDTLATYTAVPRIRVLDQGGQTLQVVEMKSQGQGVTIGRQPGNDLMLSDRSISQRHLQVLWDGNQVTVKDLGSRNGTSLEGILLIPQQSQPWMERQMIRIGPYWLRLEGASPTGTQTVQRPMAGTALYGSTGVTRTGTSATVVRSGRIGMTINPRMLSITPGQSATFQVTLYNLGTIVDWFTTTVEGVAPQWVQGAGQEVQLNPGTQETIELYVNVARVPSNLAQEYPVTIRARSREQPDESGTVQARWNVLPFTEDTLRLEPRRATGRGSATYAVALQNGGNTPTRYELRGEDDERKMDFQFMANPIDLPPGQEAKVPMTVRTRRRWIGREQRQSLQILARPAGSSIPLIAPAEFVNKALLPPWIVPAFLAFLLIAGGVVGLISGLIPRSGQNGPAIPTPDTGATLTAVIQNGANTATVSAISAQATVTANAQASAQAGIDVTGTAQANATATSQTNATATSITQANTTATSQTNATATSITQANETATANATPNIAGSYSGSFTISGQSGTYPMQMQIFQSGQNLTGTTTEGAVVYNDTGTIDNSGNFSITETSVNAGTAILSGTVVSSGHLSGTWNSSNGNESGTWDVSLT